MVQQERYEQMEQEKEEAFIDGIELALDMCEPVTKEDMDTYLRYIENRKLRESSQPDSSTRETVKTPRMMGHAR